MFDRSNENPRTAEEIPADEISIFIMNMQNMVNNYRRSQSKACDIYHDIMMKDKFVDWLEENVEPLWELYGYPTCGQLAWGKFQDEVRKTFLLDNNG
jgi:hypothetical protein